MKKLALLMMIFSSIIIFAQPARKSAPAKQNGGKTNPAMVNSIAGAAHDTCLDKKFSVVVYIIQDSAYSRTVNTYSNDLNPFFVALNNYFRPMCVSFVRCSTAIIPNYSFNEWNATSVGITVPSHWYTEDAINLYVVENVYDCGHEFAYATDVSVPGGIKGRPNIVVADAHPTATDPRHAFYFNDVNVYFTELLHAFGHIFGLPETYSEIGPPASPPPPPPGYPFLNYEFVDRSNCYTNGDGFCDTPSDCYPVGLNQAPPLVSHCLFYSGQKDGKGDFYTPPIDNFMSKYRCRCKFSQEQYNYMARYILKNKLGLH